MGKTSRTLAAASLFLVALGGSASAAGRITAAGATFPAQIYQRWFGMIAGDGGPLVNYQAVGSGSGRKAYLDQTVNFGASDDPMIPRDIRKVKRGVIQIPMVGGTIGFAYNKPGCDLKLTQEQAVKVAMSTIRDWKELGCEAGPITWVHRSDGSGTTKAFTSSMQAFSSAWTLGSGKAVNWPAGVGAKGNAGIAALIKKREGAIGYLNQSYIRGVIKAARLQNLAGEFLKPSVDSGSIALNQIQLDGNLAGSNPNPTAEGAYPIATLTWVLAYEKANGPEASTIREVFDFMLSDRAQGVAPRLGFVPLRGDILNKARAAVQRISE